MKKLTLVIAIAIVASSSIFANDKKNNETVHQQLRNEIISLLERPQFEIKQPNIIANIEFILNAKNEIVILTVDSEKQIVADYVKARLNYRKVAFDATQPDTKTFRITLKVLNPKA